MKHLSICNFGDCLGVSGNRLTVRSKEESFRNTA